MEYVYLTTFKGYETVLKGNKKYFVEGYASTIEEDFYNETITLKGQLDVLKQFMGRTVTLDIEHSAYRDENGRLATKVLPKLGVGKVVEAHLKSKGVWVKVEVNQNHPLFETVWKNIQSGILHAFSVAFNPVLKATKVIDGVLHTYYDKLNIINIALTGAPVNPGATFTPVLKSILKSQNGENMAEETNAKTDKVINEPTEQVKETDKQEKTTNANEPTEQVKETDKQEKTTDANEPTDANESIDNTEQVDNVSNDACTETQLKAINELTEIIDVQKKTISDYKKEIEETKTELKALKDEFEKFKTEPVLKGMLNNTPNKIQNNEEFNAFKYM